MVTKVITANDIDLNTLIIEDAKLKVNVANIVPAAKADNFLKEVRFESPDFIFVVGSDEGDKPEIRVPAADLVSGLATQSALDEEKAKVATLEGKVGTLETTLEEEKGKISTLESSLEEEKAKVQEAEGKITTLEQEVETLKSKTPTAEEVAAVIADDTVINAILEAIKGEEIKDLADDTKGYLIKV